MSTAHTSPTYPMTRNEARAQGLKVFPSWTACRKSSNHGTLRLAASNRCAACAQMEADIKRDLRAKLEKRLKDQADRQAMKRVAQTLVDAQKEATAIIKAAEKEAMDKVKMQERAKATREANKARKAAAASAPQPPAPEAITGPSVDDACPWD